MRFILINLFYFFFISKLDKDFDYTANTIEIGIYAKISAFRNQLSRGVNKGCCGLKQSTICIPCQFRFELVSRGYVYTPVEGIVVKKTVLGTSTKPSDYLNENYENSFFTDPDIYTRHNMEIYSLEYPSSPQDTFESIFSNKYITISYHGTFGVKNFIELWGEIEIRQITETYDFFIAFLRVDSIYWINFKTIDSQCCSSRESIECENECDYEIMWKIKDAPFYSISVSPINNERKVNVSASITSQSRFLNKIPLYYEIELNSIDQDETIDIIKIQDVKALPNVEYHLLNAMGTHGNVILNVSWMHNCLKSKGINCANNCKSDGVIANCDPINGKKFCINGALDVPTCEQFQRDCEVNPCKNNGTCFAVSGKVYCSCLNGYFGKICEDWKCESGCNGKGTCFGPDKCYCIPPYFGKDCERSPCPEDKDHNCGDNANCILIAGIKTCQCTNTFFTGENCSELICNPECIFGYCIFSKKMETPRCVCKELYGGLICDTPMKPSIPQQSAVSFIAPLVVLCLIFICLLVIYGFTVIGKIPRLQAELENYPSKTTLEK